MPLNSKIGALNQPAADDSRRNDSTSSDTLSLSKQTRVVLETLDSIEFREVFLELNEEEQKFLARELKFGQLSTLLNSPENFERFQNVFLKFLCDQLNEIPEDKIPKFLSEALVSVLSNVMTSPSDLAMVLNKLNESKLEKFLSEILPALDMAIKTDVDVVSVYNILELPTKAPENSDPSPNKKPGIFLEVFKKSDEFGVKNTNPELKEDEPRLIKPSVEMIKDLRNFEQIKKRVVAALKKYAPWWKPWGMFGHHHQSRANKVIELAEKAKNVDEISNILSFQEKLFDIKNQDDHAKLSKEYGSDFVNKFGEFFCLASKMKVKGGFYDALKEGLALIPAETPVIPAKLSSNENGEVVMQTINCFNNG